MVSLNVAQINVSGHLLKVILPEGKNNAKVILHNLAGYKLFDAVMHDNQQEYDLSAYPAGTYILSVITDSGKESKLIRL